MTDNMAQFDWNDIQKMSKKVQIRVKCSKSPLLYVKNVKKGLDNHDKFELKIAQSYVFQGKKSKTHLLNVKKVEKILDKKVEKCQNI